MEIISKKSYINQHIVCHELNHDITATELLIAKNSCVDYIDKSLIDVNDNTSFFANNFYIENLERQISQKATLLINSIEQGGGIVVQYQKGILQQKIKTHKQESQQKFNKLFRKNMLNKSIDYEYINQLLQEENKPIKKTRYSKIYPIRIARALELLLVKSIDNL